MKSSRSLGLWIVIFVAGFISGVVFSAWKLDRTPAPPLTTPMARETEPAKPDPKSRLAGLEKMVAAHPDNVQAILHLSNEYFDAGMFQNAVDACQKGLKVEPRNTDLLNNLGTALRRLGKADEAVAALQRAREIDPDHAATLFNLGLVLRDDAKDDAGALSVWEKYLEKHGDSPHAVMVKPWVAQLQKKLGSTTPAETKQ